MSADRSLHRVPTPHDGRAVGGTDIDLNTDLLHLSLHGLRELRDCSAAWRHEHLECELLPAPIQHTVAVTILPSASPKIRVASAGSKRISGTAGLNAYCPE